MIGFCVGYTRRIRAPRRLITITILFRAFRTRNTVTVTVRRRRRRRISTTCWNRCRRSKTGSSRCHVSTRWKLYNNNNRISNSNNKTISSISWTGSTRRFLTITPWMISYRPHRGWWITIIIPEMTSLSLPSRRHSATWTPRRRRWSSKTRWRMKFRAEWGRSSNNNNGSISRAGFSSKTRICSQRALLTRMRSDTRVKQSGSGFNNEFEQK